MGVEFPEKPLRDNWTIPKLNFTMQKTSWPVARTSLCLGSWRNDPATSLLKRIRGMERSMWLAIPANGCTCNKNYIHEYVCVCARMCVCAREICIYKKFCQSKHFLLSVLGFGTKIPCDCLDRQKKLGFTHTTHIFTNYSLPYSR